MVKIAALVGAEASPPMDGSETRPHSGADEGEGGAPSRQPAGRRRYSSTLNDNQRVLVDALAGAGGRAPVEALRGLDVPRTTLGTLVRRGLVELHDEAQDFAVSRIKLRRAKVDFELSPAQKKALRQIHEGAEAAKFGGMLLHGVTWVGQDRCLSCSDAPGAGAGEVVDSTGA